MSRVDVERLGEIAEIEFSDAPEEALREFLAFVRKKLRSSAEAAESSQE